LRRLEQSSTPEPKVTALQSGPHDSDRQVLAKALRRLFELWNLDQQESASLLGLKADDPTLTAIRGGAALPDQPFIVARARVLLRIHRNLQLLLPTNPQVASKWMHAPHSALNGETPIETIRNEGDAGADKVSLLLQRQFAR
jgi:hypothetical protein